MSSERYVRRPECKRRSGLSDSTIWRLEREGGFPRRRQLAPNIIGWLESELEEWLQTRAPVEGKSVSVS